MLSRLLQLVLPETCAACGTNEPCTQGFCGRCLQELLPLAATSYCPRCGTTLGPNLAERPDGCNACPTVAFRFARLVRVAPYAGPVRKAILRLKYSPHPMHMPVLANLLTQAAAARLPRDEHDLVLGVPMHWWRRLRRGRDHAGLLAAALAKGLGLPCGDDLVRLRDTTPQARLSASRRAENIRHAFGIRRGRSVKGLRIILVDDVTTTGATANEAARTLLSAGAAQVMLAVVAKADPPTAYSEQLRAEAT